jgi:hypothetical protein
MNKFNQLLESIQATSVMDTDGNQTLTVSANGEDALKLADLLKLSGILHHECTADCGHSIEEEFSNEPNQVYADTETQLVTMAGGLNGPKRQVNPNNPGDNPRAMPALGLRGSAQINIEEGELAQSLRAQFESFVQDKK